MRFSRRTDRKVKGAETRSRFYVKYGNPNYGNMTGLISNSKRQRMKRTQLSQATSDLSFEDEENKAEAAATEEPEEDPSSGGLLGRKLISYNVESSAFRQREDDLEEFGTGTESNLSSARIDLELAKKKPLYKSKKMHLYADELNAGSKRSYESQSGGEEEEEVVEQRRPEQRRPPTERLYHPPNKRFNK